MYTHTCVQNRETCLCVCFTLTWISLRSLGSSLNISHTVPCHVKAERETRYYTEKRFSKERERRNKLFIGNIRRGGGKSHFTSVSGKLATRNWRRRNIVIKPALSFVESNKEAELQASTSSQLWTQPRTYLVKRQGISRKDLRLGLHRLV